MEMINKAAYQELTEVGMPEPQAQAVAGHIPDWSQFATKDDLSQLETRLVRWLVGIFLTFLALLAGLVTISLNVTAIVNVLQG